MYAFAILRQTWSLRSLGETSEHIILFDLIFYAFYTQGMKRKVLVVLLLVLVSISLFAAPQKRSFANLSGEDVQGNLVDNSILANRRYTIINIFTTWCPHCAREFPELVKLSAQLPEGIGLVGLCEDGFDAPEDLDDIVEYYKIKYPIVKVTDENLTSCFDVYGFPTTLLVDSNGSVVTDVMSRTASGILTELKKYF